MQYTKIVDGIEKDVIEFSIYFRYLFYSEIGLMLEKFNFKVIDIDTGAMCYKGHKIIQHLCGFQPLATFTLRAKQH